MPPEDGTDLFAGFPGKDAWWLGEGRPRPVSLAVLAPPFEGEALSLAGATAFAADYRAGAEVRTILSGRISQTPTAQPSPGGLSSIWSRAPPSPSTHRQRSPGKTARKG